MHKPASLLASDVKDELDWDPLLDAKRILVEASEGQITLTGAVDTYFDLIRASEDAHSVRGVKAVDNQLLVGPIGEAIADVGIAEDSRAALDADRFVPAGAVTAQVTDGWVTLSGHVHRHYQRAPPRSVRSKGSREYSVSPTKSWSRTSLCRRMPTRTSVRHYAATP